MQKKKSPALEIRSEVHRVLSRNCRRKKNQKPMKHKELKENLAIQYSIARKKVFMKKDNEIKNYE